MPRNLNAWLDICFILFAALILTGILTYYNLFIGLGAGLVWLCLLFLAESAVFAAARSLNTTVIQLLAM